MTNANGDVIIKASKSEIVGAPNTITQIEHEKGGIARNYYGSDGFQTKQISNNDHNEAKKFGKHGEHAHDYAFNSSGQPDRGKKRELSDEERKENADIL